MVATVMTLIENIWKNSPHRFSIYFVDFFFDIF